MVCANLTLVTGASSGLGKALCLALNEQKIPLIITGRDQDKLKELASQLDISPIVLPLDLAISADRQHLIDAIREHTPDLIINNAGFGMYGDALSYSTAEALEMIELNVQALVEISLEGARQLIRQGKKGTILNVSSAASF